MTHLHPNDARALIDSHDDVVLLDVREAWEYNHCRLEDAVHIPLGILPLRLSELDSSIPHLVYCHHGSRSVSACRVMERAGFTNVYNLYGGIQAWSDFVDPAVKKY